MEIGINTEITSDTDIYNFHLDELKNNNILLIRVSMPSYNNASGIVTCKNNVLQAVAKGLNVIWGLSAPATITAASWVDYRLAVLDAAQWSQDNGVHEFQLGNEEEGKVDGTTMTLAGVVTALKSLATEVKAIFTNGSISYAIAGDAGHPEELAAWTSTGRGDIDLIGLNVYHYSIASIIWKTTVNNLVSAFGGNCYITEYAPCAASLDTYSTNEDIQANGTEEMIKYFLSKGINKCCFYSYFSVTDKWGALKTDGSYRELWNVLVAYANPPEIQTGTAGQKWIKTSYPYEKKKEFRFLKPRQRLV